MSYTNRLSEVMVPILRGGPASTPAIQTVTATPVAVPVGFQRFCLILSTSDLIGGVTFVVKPIQADAPGISSNQKEIPGKVLSIDSISNGSISIIEWKAEELDLANGFDAAIGWEVQALNAGVAIWGFVIFGLEPRDAAAVHTPEGWNLIVD